MRPEIGFSDSGHPIQFTTDLAVKITAWLTVALPTDDPLLTPGHSGVFSDPVVASETYRFYLALLGYFRSDRPLLTVREILNGVMAGPEYITFLKRIRSYILVTSSGGHFLEDDAPPEVKEWCNGKSIFDIGQVFNVRYWLFWAQPDEEDWRYFWEPIKPLEPKFREEFREAVMGILPEVVDIVEEEEILLQLSSSSARLPNGETGKVWQIKEKYNHFCSDPLVGWATFLDKCPGDTRTTITLTVPHSNTIKLIEKQVAEIASEVPFSCYVKDTGEYFKRYEKFSECTKYYLCRDLKKDGITKNRELLQVIASCIQEKYPYLPACKYMGVYDNFYYYGPNPSDPSAEVKNNPPRGIGLGMSAAFTTILQSALFKLTLDRLYENTIEDGSVTALFYHDDAAIGSDNKELLEEFSSIEDQVMLDSRQIKNKKKSFFAEWFVLCENYSNGYDRKQSYQNAYLLAPHSAANIVHAKHIWASNLRYVDSVDWKPYMVELYNHFGYEFYYDEMDYPLSLGGWLPTFYQGVDVSLVIPEVIDRQQKAAGLAIKQYRVPIYDKRIKDQKRIYRSPYKQLYPHLDYTGYEEEYVIGQNIRDVSRIFSNFDKVGSQKGYWAYQKRMRFENYKYYYELNLDLPSFFSAYHAAKKDVDILPPRDLLVTMAVKKDEVGRPYHPPNPRLQFLAWLNPGKIKKSVIPYPIPPGVVMDRRVQATSWERKQMQYNLDTLKVGCHLGEPSHYWINPAAYEGVNHLYNPNCVEAACLAFYNLQDILPVTPDRECLVSTRGSASRYLGYLSGDYACLTQTYISRFGVGIAENLFDTTVLEDIEEGLKEILYKKRMLNAYLYAAEHKDPKLRSENPFGSNVSEDRLYEVDSNFVWTESPLQDNEYFIWETSRRNYRNWRQAYFEEIHNRCVELQSNMFNMSYAEAMELMEPFNPIELHLWKTSGGKVDERGLPLLIDTFFDARDDSEAEEKDIFADSDSDGPFAFGFGDEDHG